MLSNGQGVEKNIKLAFDFFKSSAEKGVSKAQYTVATWLRKGVEEIKKDTPKAIYWYKQAAKQNLAEAMNDLASIYFLGKDIEKDEKEAFQLYKQAAEQNLASAQYSVALMYINIEKNVEKGLFWMSQAAQQAYIPAVKFLEDISEGNNSQWRFFKEI